MDRIRQFVNLPHARGGKDDFAVGAAFVELHHQRTQRTNNIERHDIDTSKADQHRESDGDDDAFLQLVGKPEQRFLVFDSNQGPLLIHKRGVGVIEIQRPQAGIGGLSQQGLLRKPIKVCLGIVTDQRDRLFAREIGFEAVAEEITAAAEDLILRLF